MSKKNLTWTVPAITFAVAACGFSATPAHADDSMAHPLYYPYSVGLEAGLAGPGVSASVRFADHFGARVGVDYFKYDRSGTIENVNWNGSLQLASEPLTLDWYPWTARSFHVSVGVAFNENKFTGTANNTGNITINGNTYGPGQLGTLDLKIQQQLLNAYLSIGGNLFYFDSAHHWAMTGELGAMYGGKPSVSLSQSGANGAVPQSQINTDVAAERNKIQHYANYIQFWPEAKLGVSFSF